MGFVAVALIDQHWEFCLEGLSAEHMPPEEAVSKCADDPFNSVATPKDGTSMLPQSENISGCIHSMDDDVFNEELAAAILASQADANDKEQSPVQEDGTSMLPQSENISGCILSMDDDVFNEEL